MMSDTRGVPTPPPGPITVREVSALSALIEALRANAIDPHVDDETRASCAFRADALQHVVSVAVAAERSAPLPPPPVCDPVDAAAAVAPEPAMVGEWLRAIAVVVNAGAECAFRPKDGPLGGVHLAVQLDRRSVPELFVARRRNGEYLLSTALVHPDGSPVRLADDAVLAGVYRPSLVDERADAYDWTPIGAQN